MRVIPGLVLVAGSMVLAALWMSRGSQRFQNSFVRPEASQIQRLAWRRPQTGPTNQVSPATIIDSRSQHTEHGMAAGLASHLMVTSEEHSTAPPRFVDGVEATKAIDWSAVTSMSPIPRVMPTGPAADAVDAGFAPEWFEHSIGRWTADSINYHGKFETIRIQSLASQIMSESKSADDNWANGMELQLRSMIASDTSADSELISRVFCNGQGCLCYIEDEDHSLHESARQETNILKSLRDDPWAQKYGIVYPGAYFTGMFTGTWGWALIVIPRPK